MLAIHLNMQRLGRRAKQSRDVRSVDAPTFGGWLALVVDKANLLGLGGGRFRLAKGHVHDLLTMTM